ncbi:hypothetical protein PMZ80_000531 [Knufia obscura]|uniref:Oxidoreductase molybdopterin-binding domain-containing protein n=2 Tax=Knufia TaxID=430999 RepID=A0AAN8IAC0_9EURO|nr:hypothetical protein PMZ80_000531 [Knufia obscura]KAK5956541.1 hypothetical protein OHC33_002026 [Knufia fluminis]
MNQQLDPESFLQHVTLLDATETDGSERNALVEVRPRGFHYRAPQPPHQLTSPYTSEADLFQTIHMGPAVVDRAKWHLVIDGLVARPFSVSWSQLMQFPKESITAFHECYGSPVKPPTTNLWRIGNVIWGGVRLDILLNLAQPLPEARYVWSDGLENGSFGEAKHVDRYQKDMTLVKAMTPGCLVAYEMNGEPLGKERGGPVRLIVPGWYGTNSTKWLCRLTLQETRSKSPFTTMYYNEVDPTDVTRKRKRPCWDVEPNSFLLTMPAEDGEVEGPQVKIAGRAWGAIEIKQVSICVREKNEWVERATVTLLERKQYEWQYFEAVINLEPGRHQLMARATDQTGMTQPVSGRRNHAHIIEISVK